MNEGHENNPGCAFLSRVSRKCGARRFVLPLMLEEAAEGGPEGGGACYAPDEAAEVLTLAPEAILCAPPFRRCRTAAGRDVFYLSSPQP